MSITKRSHVIVIVGVLLLASGAAAYTGVIDVLSFGTTVEEPISITEDANWSATMYPGEQINAKHTLTNPDADEDYVVAVELANFSGTDNGTDTLNSSRYKDNGYISKVSWDGQDHTFDLLNDGTADFYKINKTDSTGVPQELNVTTLESAQNGTINITFNYSRVSAGTAPSAVVRQHYNASDNCGECHGGSSSTAVHSNQTESGDTCEDCHDSTMQDVHMDCTSACHTSYPITNSSGGAPHGPFADKPISSEYYCSGDCHGSQMTLAHNNTNTTDAVSGYDPLSAGFCPSCHGDTTTVDTSQNDTLMTFHGTFEKDCKQCHGIGSDELHSTYDGGDCETCHSMN